MTRPYFECIATIQAGFFMLRQHLRQEDDRSPLECLIDESTGYDREKREWVRTVVQDIRDAQAEIGEDTTEADQVLASLAPEFVTFRFVINGEPVGKARPRFGNGRTYTPESTRAYEELVGWSARQAGLKPQEGPVAVEIEAFYGMPARSKTQEGDPCMKRPDVDNIAKAICDACNGIAYRDDAQVVDLRVTKKWSRTPRVEVAVIYL